MESESAGHKLNLAKFKDHLADGFRVIALDQRSYGRIEIWGTCRSDVMILYRPYRLEVLEYPLFK